MKIKSIIRNLAFIILTAGFTACDDGMYILLEDNPVVSEDYFFNTFDIKLSPTGPMRVTNEIAWSTSSSLTWTGGEFGIVWEDTRNGGLSKIYFAKIDTGGNKIGATDKVISENPGNSQNPSLVWTGTEYGVSWDVISDDEIYFARIDTDGNRIGNVKKITNYTDISMMPSLVWTGTEYGVCWEDTRNTNQDLYFARINPDGTKIGINDDQITSDGGNSWEPSLIWAKTKYGVGWHDNRDGPQSEIYFEIY